MIVRVPNLAGGFNAARLLALGGLGACDLDKIPAPCDPWKTQEFGCVCADANGMLLNPQGGIVDIYGASAGGFALPNFDQKTLGFVLGGALILLLAVRR